VRGRHRLFPRTAAACLAIAAGCELWGVLSAHPASGLSLAVGLLIGSTNALLAERAVGADVPFHMSSLARLGVLTAAALAVGLAIGTATVWLTLIGVAGAQFVFAGVSVREAMRQ